jgi:outer membrane protein assembly factor BamB
MKAMPGNDESPREPLRLWPGVAAAVLLALARYVLPLVVPGTQTIGVLGGLAGSVAILVWWLFFSRAPWIERGGALALMIVAMVVTSRFLHVSIANGALGMLFPLYAIPVLSLGLVGSAAATRRLPDGIRRGTMAATVLIACGSFMLLRTEGVSGGGGSAFRWRWMPSAEERLLARAGDDPVSPPAAQAERERYGPAPVPRVGREPATPKAESDRAAAAGRRDERGTSVLPEASSAASGGVAAEANWPGFRGPDRNGVVPGVRIETDWTRSPPVRLWRRPVGPGWSSFAVLGDLLFTQEQRGDYETVACYRVSTGEPVWRHRDPVRFWESNAGAGPRATPTFGGGRVFAFGATGLLNALDIGNGAVLWSRDVASDTAVTVPIWGFAGSPLLVDDLVVVAAAGRLAAYDAASGSLKWLGPNRGGSYSSPHRWMAGDVLQVLLLHDAGVTGVAPATGAVLWEHAWPGAAIVQPAVLADNSLLVSTAGASGGLGVRRLAVGGGPGNWTVGESWSSTGLKPYFNDLVTHKGHAYGFDGSILACVDLQDGTRTWKGGRYGNGQLVLLADQDVLLVLSEDGDLALVAAVADGFRELARMPAIEGKTWNHPVLTGDILLVRNGEEMAAFRLPLATR